MPTNEMFEPGDTGSAHHVRIPRNHVADRDITRRRACRGMVADDQRRSAVRPRLSMRGKSLAR